MSAMKSNGYQSGFGNSFATEALAGTLPVGRNSPQKVAHGLYAEQLSGTAFTAPRSENRRSWLYRIRPAAMHGTFEPYSSRHGAKPRLHNDFGDGPVTPDQLRWNPMPMPDGEAAVDFVDGLFTMAGNGSPAAMHGVGIHVYAANRDMIGRFFYDADGELLVVPQQGRLHIDTELGVLEVEPQEIAVIPRGVRFRVWLPDGQARGYVCENFGALMRLPDLGPIGSNGLANARDFLAPCAAYEDQAAADGKPFELIAKFQGHLWRADIGHSPLDVVGWHGNYAPYKYDLRRFNTIGSISYDHPDPSIFLVLTSPSDTPGVGNMDLAIFPPRWLVAQDTFRPPWFHRNVASEFMGLVHGAYDAKADGFAPGGASLHNCMTGHGPDAATFEKASHADLSKPDVITDTMAFMFETRGVIRPTAQAIAAAHRQRDYQACWAGLKQTFRRRRLALARPVLSRRVHHRALGSVPASTESNHVAHPVRRRRCRRACSSWPSCLRRRPAIASRPKHPRPLHRRQPRHHHWTSQPESVPPATAPTSAIDDAGRCPLRRLCGVAFRHDARRGGAGMGRCAQRLAEAARGRPGRVSLPQSRGQSVASLLRADDGARQVRSLRRIQ